jgi:hypothetical protein
MNEELALEKRLDYLREKHREIDTQVKDLDPRSDVFLLNRLKKEKLSIRDEITRIEAELYPDIVA